MKIIEPQKNFAEEVITVDALDMEAITMDSEDDEEEKIEVKEDNIKVFWKLFFIVFYILLLFFIFSYEN